MKFVKKIFNAFKTIKDSNKGAKQLKLKLKHKKMFNILSVLRLRADRKDGLGRLGYRAHRLHRKRVFLKYFTHWYKAWTYDN